MEFHPTQDNLLLTGGLDKRVKLTLIEKKESKDVGSVYLSDLPIHGASFIRSGAEVCFVI
jgi:hypothetical protein